MRPSCAGGLRSWPMARSFQILKLCPFGVLSPPSNGGPLHTINPGPRTSHTDQANARTRHRPLPTRGLGAITREDRARHHRDAAIPTCQGAARCAGAFGHEHRRGGGAKVVPERRRSFNKGERHEDRRGVVHAKLFTHETWKATPIGGRSIGGCAPSSWRYSTVLRAVAPISFFAALWAYTIAHLPRALLPRTSPVPMSLMGTALGLLLVFRTNNSYLAYGRREHCGRRCSH